VRGYTTNPDFTTDVQAQAIDLVNNDGVWGLVTDENFVTADVTNLNYESPLRINKNVAVTCFQCGTSKIHGPGEFYAGFADPFYWMSRTFFNDHFEAPVHARVVHGRIRGGDLNNDGYVKVVTYYDPEHERPGLFFSEYLDALTPGPHSTNPVNRSGIFSFDMQNIFDPGPDGHAPDVVVVMMGLRDGLPALQAYKNYSAPTNRRCSCRGAPPRRFAAHPDRHRAARHRGRVGAAGEQLALGNDLQERLQGRHRPRSRADRLLRL
jgi:hypothetical protein